MADHRLLDADGNLMKTFVSEDGKHYRHYRQDMDPVIDHVAEQRHLNMERKGWGHVASIPPAILHDWLVKSNRTLQDFYQDPTVRQDFIVYFTSRNFSKLHNKHVTTKQSDTGFHFTG